ncbi:MAG: hypothetical protein SOU05_04005 [Atopobium sp.]|uniref:hypothetical protein n=1 Tax=Atopobium sp. TaxID=1872650 RepID=UPI002A75B5E1|nr:hypothetical protein [Atopobium sp.]MDY2788553.1 hypothetical protein [Atopobium sp.]
MKHLYGIAKIAIGSALIASATYFLILTKENREEVNDAIKNSIKTIVYTKNTIAQAVKKNEKELDQSLELLQDSVKQQWNNLEQ